HLAIYAAHLCTLAERFGVPRARLLEAAGVEARVLEDAEGRVSGPAMGRLVQQALLLTGEPGLGLYHGLQLKVSSHGMVGMAAMSSATLGDAIRVGIRYAQLRARHLRMSLQLEG